MSPTKQPSIRVLMLPWLAHGHISPFLELAKKLCSSNIAVYLCSTPANLSSVEKRIDSETFPHLHLAELHLPADEDLPPHLHTTKNLPSHLMPALKTAFDRSAPTFSRLLESLSPHLLIYDFILPWAPVAAAQHSIPAVVFLPIAACTAAFFIHHLTRSPEDQLPFPAPRFPDPKQGEIMAMVNRMTNGISDGERMVQCLSRSDGFVALRSFREIDAKYIDYLSSIIQKEVVPVKPLLSPDENGGGEEAEWLSGKEKGTVVFVSVGSEYFMTEKEREEMGRGLDLCGLCFIWSVRSEGGDGRRRVSEISGGRGLLVEGWAAQKKILAHPSVGGFVTHCGWSSVMEGIMNGVPMVAVPLQLDQPINAELVVELGVGLKVREGGGCKFDGDEVARCIKEVVVGEKAGESVRRRAKEMARAVCAKGDGGINGLLEKIHLLVAASASASAGNERRVQPHEVGSTSAVLV
ncbi:Flavanone 7-O-glucoside 2''-O-beta-L-rhamnosyltransferase [Platanthera zijinensis]|uniref:Glycosyltransferase n=1 Tax=Platanthera zijinensis TaxID=2320716 RepID=A0AAP0GG54_9ASPA